MPTTEAMAKAIKAAILRRFPSDVDNGGQAPIDSLLRAIRQVPSNIIYPNHSLASTNYLRRQLSASSEFSASTTPPSTSELADQLLHDAIVCACIKIRTSYTSSSSSALETLLFAINGMADIEPSIKEDMLQQALEMLVGKSPPPAKYFDNAVAPRVDKLSSSNQGEEEKLSTADRVSISDDQPAKRVVASGLIQSMPLSNQATTWALAEQLIRVFNLRPTPTMVADVFIKAFADAAEQLAAAYFLTADQAAAALHAALDRSPSDDKQELKKYLNLAGEKLRPPPTASDEVLKKVVLRVAKAIMSSNPQETPIFAFYSAARMMPDKIVRDSPVVIDAIVDQFVLSTKLPTIIEQLKLYGSNDLESASSHHTQLPSAEQFISFFKVNDDNLPTLPPVLEVISDDDLAGDKLVAAAFKNAAEEMMETVRLSLRPWASPRHALLAGVIDFMEKEHRFPEMEAIQLLLRRDSNSPATVDEAFRKAAKAALSSIMLPPLDRPVEHLLSAIGETLADHDEEVTKPAVYERLILSTVPIGRHPRPGSNFLVNGFVRAIQEEWPEEPPELEQIAAGVGRAKGMEEEKVKEVVMGALSVAWRRLVDGERAMDEGGPSTFWGSSLHDGAPKPEPKVLGAPPSEPPVRPWKFGMKTKHKVPSRGEGVYIYTSQGYIYTSQGLCVIRAFYKFNLYKIYKDKFIIIEYFYKIIKTNIYYS